MFRDRTTKISLAGNRFLPSESYPSNRPKHFNSSILPPNVYAATCLLYLINNRNCLYILFVRI